jgi:hypothetical protein
MPPETPAFKRCGLGLWRVSTPEGAAPPALWRRPRLLLIGSRTLVAVSYRDGVRAGMLLHMWMYWDLQIRAARVLPP